MRRPGVSIRVPIQEIFSALDKTAVGYDGNKVVGIAKGGGWIIVALENTFLDWFLYECFLYTISAHWGFFKNQSLIIM